MTAVLHQAINNFWRYLAVILKRSGTFTLKKLRCELSSSFEIFSDTEGGDILLLQIALMIETKKENENKENIE